MERCELFSQHCYVHLKVKLYVAIKYGQLTIYFQQVNFHVFKVKQRSKQTRFYKHIATDAIHISLTIYLNHNGPAPRLGVLSL